MFVISRALLCLRMKIKVGQMAIAGSKLEDGEEEIAAEEGLLC